MRVVLVLLTTGAFLTGWASKVQALPEVNPQPQDGQVTPSSESLSGLQGRSITKDFPRTPVGTLPNTPRSNNSHNTNAAGSSFLTRLLGANKKIEFGVVGQEGSSVQNSSSLPPVVKNGDANGGFSVRYRLNE